MGQSETDDRRCHGRLWDTWRGHRCSYRGKVEVNGKWYCGIHDPHKREQRKAEREQEMRRVRSYNQDIAGRVRRVAKALGITATVDGWSGSSHKELATVAVVPLEELEQLASRLEEIGFKNA